MTLVVNGTTGIGLTAGNVPSFSAYRPTAQSIAQGGYVLMQLNTKEFDTSNAFDATTNFRFQPTVPGYYLLEGQILMGATSGGGNVFAAIFKNGTIVRRGTSAPNNAVDGGWVTVTGTIFLNGSTDYVDLRVYQGSTGAVNTSTGGTSAENRFAGILVRPDQVFPIATPVTVNNGPLFSAYQSVVQSFVSGTTTKVIFDTKEFDTGNYFTTSTSRYLPLVSGYYKVDATVSIGSVCLIEIWKNGVAFKRGFQYPANTNGFQAGVVSGLVFLNGSTDYIEIYMVQYGGTTVNTAVGSPTPHLSYFSAAMVRQ